MKDGGQGLGDTGKTSFLTFTLELDSLESLNLSLGGSTVNTWYRQKENAV